MMKTLVLATLGLGLAFGVVACGSGEATMQGQGVGGRSIAAPSTQPAHELTLDLGDKVTAKLVQTPAGLFVDSNPEKVTLKLVLIPAGEFLMGSPEAEKGRDEGETRHEVTISKPFYLGVTHVTVGQFKAFVKDSRYETDAEKDGWSFGFEPKDGKIALKRVDGCAWHRPSFEQQEDHPVVQVSWNDAQAFCIWLSKKSGNTVVLPTEAQWEYACRAGTKTTYPWGDDPNGGKGWANCADQSLKKEWPNAPADSAFLSWDDGFAFTSPVGSFRANAFGLYDMNGNALQWCQDRYGDYGKGAATDPTGADTGGSRVLRGGAWVRNLFHCRAANRVGIRPDDRNDFSGFRVVVVAASGD